MLRDAGETARLISCATDLARHDRMFALSGGYNTALIELTMAQEAVLGQDDPDLPAMARLAMHRDDISGRAAAIPVDLPAVSTRS